MKILTRILIALRLKKAPQAQPAPQATVGDWQRRARRANVPPRPMPAPAPQAVAGFRDGRRVITVNGREIDVTTASDKAPPSDD